MSTFHCRFCRFLLSIISRRVIISFFLLLVDTAPGYLCTSSTVAISSALRQLHSRATECVVEMCLETMLDVRV